MTAAQPFDFDWIWSIMGTLQRAGGFVPLALLRGHQAIPDAIEIPVIPALAVSIGPVVFPTPCRAAPHHRCRQVGVGHLGRITGKSR